MEARYKLSRALEEEEAAPPIDAINLKRCDLVWSKAQIGPEKCAKLDFGNTVYL